MFSCLSEVHCKRDFNQRGNGERETSEWLNHLHLSWFCLAILSGKIQSSIRHTDRDNFLITHCI